MTNRSICSVIDKEGNKTNYVWDDELNQLVVENGDNVTEFDKITPETYKKMNEEFEEEGLAFRIKVPTQEEINDWRQRDQNEYRQEPGGKN